MGWFGIGKEKQRQPSQETATDAELAFELWDSGWDGWIASEPALPVKAEAQLSAASPRRPTEIAEKPAILA